MAARWLLPALLALLVPASAAAAPLGELKPFEVSGNDCVTATDVRGELTVATETGMRFLRASRGGIVPASQVTLVEDGSFNCYAAKVRASGAGVIVGTASGNLVAAVRDPGGTWSATRTLERFEGTSSLGSVAAAVSDRGDVLVAWTENGPVEARLRAVRRAPAGSFGAVTDVVSPLGGTGGIAAGVADGGEALVAWTRPGASKPPSSSSVWVTSAPPGDAFGAPVRVLDTHRRGAPAFAVAPDGRALVAGWNGASLLVAERAPGAAFGPATPVGAAVGRYLGAAAAIAAGGAAAIVWERPVEGDALVVSRTAGGSFSAPVVVPAGASLLPSGFDPFFLTESYEQASDSIFTPGLEEGPPAPRLTDDGRAIVAVAVRRRVGKTLRTLPTVAAVPLGTAAFTASSAGPQLLDEPAPEPLFLDDGTPAVFWRESDDPSTFYPTKPYRLHVAADGVAEPADPPAPRVTVGTPADRVLDEDDSTLKLPIRCSAACVVRARIDYALDPLENVLRLSRAGRGTLLIESATIAAPARRGPVRIHLSYSAPGALHPVERLVTVRLSRSVLLPRITAVRARRAGNTVRVSWRVNHPSPGLPYYVSGAATRDANAEPLATRAIQQETKGRQFTLTLRGARDVRFVTVRPEIPVGPGAQSVVVVVR